MTRWFNRRTLTAILLVAGAVMLQGCVYDPSGPYPAYGGHGYVTPFNDRGGEGGGNGGGGMM
jgi:hypothetical protein